MQLNNGGHGRRIVVVSDFRDGDVFPALGTVEDFAQAWAAGARGPRPGRQRGDDVPLLPAVKGGYLERLPLAAVRHGLCDTAEIWSFWAHAEPPPWRWDGPMLIRRGFQADGPQTPYVSRDMLGHIAAFGPPDILCVWGLGVAEDILQACDRSFKVYNSIDAPALRMPDEVSRHFDLILTGADWQSAEVRARHPDIPAVVMPIGPEFASPETFFPLDLPKVYDVIYVAAAQAYKRHDILFDALARLPRTVRALCVCGYGEDGDALRRRVCELGISVDFVGPPGVGFEEVNRLMNTARIGVVCGVDDGAPAILTEYMLAGLPVLANADLRCGLQYITPATGRTAYATDFHMVLQEMLADLTVFRPRAVAMAQWTWPVTIDAFASLVSTHRGARAPQI